MKIIITGCLGYVGTEVLKYFKNSPHEIIGIDQDFIPDKVKKMLRDGYKFYQRDIFDIADILKDADICYHFAAITKVPQTINQSNKEIDSLIYNVGINGTRYILNNTDSKCKIVFASTHVVWEGLETSVFDIEEDYPVKPVLAYAKSKYQSELDIINSGRRFVIARLATVYGYNESTRFSVLNLFSKLASQSQPIKLFGGGDNYKSFVGIKDVARAMIDFANYTKYDNNIFLLCNDNLTVKEVANICIENNPRINLTTTNDEVINKGYTVSHKKITNLGFRFKQSARSEIKKMINMWSNK